MKAIVIASNGFVLELSGIVKYLLNFLMNFDFLKLIVEEYKLLVITSWSKLRSSGFKTVVAELCSFNGITTSLLF